MKKIQFITINTKNRYDVPLKYIIESFIYSEFDSYDWPFERKFLTFLSVWFKPSTHETINEEKWTYIYKCYKKLKLIHPIEDLK